MPTAAAASSPQHEQFPSACHHSNRLLLLRAALARVTVRTNRFDSGTAVGALESICPWSRQLLVRKSTHRVRIALQIAVRHLGIRPRIFRRWASRGRALAETWLVLILDVLVNLCIHARGIDGLLDLDCPPGAARTVADEMTASAFAHCWMRIPLSEVRESTTATAASFRDRSDLVRSWLAEQIAVRNERAVRRGRRLVVTTVTGSQAPHLPAVAFFLGTL